MTQIFVIYSSYWDDHPVSYWTTKEKAEEEKRKLEKKEKLHPSNTCILCKDCDYEYHLLVRNHQK